MEHGYKRTDLNNNFNPNIVNSRQRAVQYATLSYSSRFQVSILNSNPTVRYHLLFSSLVGYISRYILLCSYVLLISKISPFS